MIDSPWLTRVICYHRTNSFLFSFVSFGIPTEFNLTHFFFYYTFRVTPSIKPRSHFRSVLSKILRLGTYPTNPQTLTKYYRSLSVIWVREIIMKTLMRQRWLILHYRVSFLTCEIYLWNLENLSYKTNFFSLWITYGCLEIRILFV